MGNIQNTFKRYELKYLVTQEEKEELLQFMVPYMQADQFGASTICNVYYDTPDYRLIRNSMEKPVYKEKLRLRSYGVAAPGMPVYVELKKKYQHVVYKRRVQLTQQNAVHYLAGTALPAVANQITEEIDYFISLYENIQPTAHISYRREAFYGVADQALRITFDDTILWRSAELSLALGIYGVPILPAGQSLMEVKVDNAMPLWLVYKLGEMRLYKTSFSKYGRAYEMMMTASERLAANVKEVQEKRRNYCA